jgi:hypothetical protein
VRHKRRDRHGGEDRGEFEPAAARLGLVWGRLQASQNVGVGLVADFHRSNAPSEVGADQENRFEQGSIVIIG